MSKQEKHAYSKPMVEELCLGLTLSFLDQGFSSGGYLGGLEDGGEFGDHYEGGNGIVNLEDGGEFGS